MLDTIHTFESVTTCLASYLHNTVDSWNFSRSHFDIKTASSNSVMCRSVSQIYTHTKHISNSPFLQLKSPNAHSPPTPVDARANVIKDKVKMRRESDPIQLSLTYLIVYICEGSLLGTSWSLNFICFIISPPLTENHYSLIFSYQTTLLQPPSVWFLHVKYCAMCFSNISSFNPHNNTMGQLLLHSWGNGGSTRLSHLFTIAKLVQSFPNLEHTQAFLLPLENRVSLGWRKNKRKTYYAFFDRKRIWIDIKVFIKNLKSCISTS